MLLKKVLTHRLDVHKGNFERVLIWGPTLERHSQILLLLSENNSSPTRSKDVILALAIEEAFW